jgi:nucleotide-binding universal stress UspA family protein
MLPVPCEETPIMLTTIQAIVCAVDFSPFSPLVVGYGVSLARRAGVRLYLIHAVNDPQDGSHPTAVFERGGDLIHLTDDARQRFRELMRRTDVAWEAVVRFGDPVEQTTAFVDSLPPSLVVSASHGVSGFQRLFIGTVVERLTRALSSPMLVVKAGDGDVSNPSDGFRRAVVGCDDHGCWHQLGPLMSLLQPDRDSRIHLVRAMERPMDNTLGDADAVSYGQAQQALQDRLNRDLRERAQRLFPHADALSVEVAPGVPQEMVLAVARQRAADIIVVGVRRSRKMERWISGSTTEALLRRSPCSVLTVPEADHRRLPGGDHR